MAVVTRNRSGPRAPVKRNRPRSSAGVCRRPVGCLQRRPGRARPGRAGRAPRRRRRGAPRRAGSPGRRTRGPGPPATPSWRIATRGLVGEGVEQQLGQLLVGPTQLDRRPGDRQRVGGHGVELVERTGESGQELVVVVEAMVVGRGHRGASCEEGAELGRVAEPIEAPLAGGSDAPVGQVEEVAHLGVGQGRVEGQQVQQLPAGRREPGEPAVERVVQLPLEQAARPARARPRGRCSSPTSVGDVAAPGAKQRVHLVAGGGRHPPGQLGRLADRCRAARRAGRRWPANASLRSSLDRSNPAIDRQATFWRRSTSWSHAAASPASAACTRGAKSSSPRPPSATTPGTLRRPVTRPDRRVIVVVMLHREVQGQGDTCRRSSRIWIPLPVSVVTTGPPRRPARQGARWPPPSPRSSAPRGSDRRRPPRDGDALTDTGGRGAR